MKQSEPEGDVQEASRGAKIRRKERPASPETSHEAGERSDRFRRLIGACKRKELDTIRRLLAEQPELLNYHDKHHRNLLHYVSILVVDDERSGGGRDQRRQLLAECLDCFRYLASKCEPKLWFQVDRDGLTVLHLAVISCNSALVREILFNQSQLYELKRQRAQQFELASLITALDKEQHSPLHWAVITNNLECVRLLIEHSGVQLVHQTDLNGATPLHYATQTSDYPKYRQQLRQMLKNATASARCSTPTSPRSLSSAGSSVYERKDSVGPTDDQVNSNSACSQHASNKLEILDFLAHLPGADLECRDKDLRTPLLWAASSGNRQAIFLLLQSGANYLCQDANKLGPLHCAASHGFIDCLECLLSLSANSTTNTSQIINQPDNLNCTPLFYAVLSGNIDCVELLLERGAKKDWQDVKGRAAAHFGALRGQLNTLKLLESHGANLWLANKQGDLPLHYAIKSGRQKVVAWLLDRSPYERPVNAINNRGRAPIHLAILKNNANMVDFLIRRGANLNQLVRMRDKGAPKSDEVQLALVNTAGVHQTRSGTSTFHYETALDMARRLNQRDLIELLERNSAKSAANVLASRQVQTGLAQTGLTGNVRSLFDLQAADVASPIGFETGGSSAEPPSDQQRPPPMTGARLPKISMRPKAMAEPVPQSSDSANSSALSHSSLTSLHGQPKVQKVPTQAEQFQNQSTTTAAQPIRRRPFKGGMNYNNDRISASIKCKLYENKATAPHSFPPLENAAGHHSESFHHKYHSAGSLAEQQTGTTRGNHSSAGQQEIITNVNVYTSSPCAQCSLNDGSLRSQQQLQRKCSNCSSQGEHNLAQRGVVSTRARTTQSGLPLDGMISETSDSTDATSTIYDESEREDELDLGARNETHLPALNLVEQTNRAVAADSQPMRYMPTSRIHSQHLPVILSAEEERSTSGETDTNQQSGKAPVLSPDDFMRAAPLGNRGPFANQEPRFDRSQRCRASTRRAERFREQVRSPVAEYIHAREPQGQRQLVSDSTRSSWAQLQPSARLDYSQVKAKVDSHRNDSGLSSHFGDELDGASLGGRRSKSWSSNYSAQPDKAQPVSSGQFGTRSDLSSSRQLNEPLAGNQSRSCSRQAIIKTRRLSVDTDELATTIEKSIRRYKHESKLFEELQNLKRSQIRSGRANESLLVKRLAEHFRQEVLRDCLIGLDAYRGPYTYQAYELYLYDQLKKLSQTNYAMLMGGRVPHKFTHHGQLDGDDQRDQELSEPEQVLPADSLDNQEAREFLEEDLKAEQELQRVLKRSSVEATTSESIQEASPTPIGRGDETVAIEPSGALGDIRVRRRDNEEDSWPVETSQQGGGQELDQDADKTRAREAADDLAIKERLEKQARSSNSAGSSRRSSVEAEQEKLDKLPLRVNQLDQKQCSTEETQVDESERQQIEKEAIDLTSAILVDALGNVSRAGSPQRFKECSDESENDQNQKSEEAEEQVGEWANETAVQGRGRRRSVVNIGDKIEVIYHKVGIEIDTVAENEDPGAEDGAEETSAATVQERRDSNCSEMSDAAGEDQAEKVENELEEMEGIEDPEESRHSRAETIVRGTTEQDEDELDTPKRRTSSIAQAANLVGSLDSVSRSNLRRASSPHGLGTSERGQQVTGSRRSSSPAHQTADATATRRIFNGFDLDSLREDRRRHRLASKQEAGDVGEKTEPAVSGVIKVEKSTRKQLRKLRTQIPRGPYKVYVPTELIRKRWNQVKRQERAQARSSNALKVAASDEMSHAVSQPNLSVRQTSQDELNEQIESKSKSCSNFILIYELNTPQTCRDSELKELEATTSKKIIWCQKRMTRIVDVRTLKRTLSLPESLIYSNELLKRFNLLKL